MKSSNNEPHYMIFSVFVINSLYMSDILLIISLTVPQNTLFLQRQKSHFIPIKMRGMFDLSVDDTFHYKWYCTCSGSQNIYFLKNCL